MIPNHKGEVPVALLLLPFVFGILIGGGPAAGVNTTFLYWAFGFCCITFIVLNLKYSALKLYKQRWLGGSLVALILFLFGWILPIRYNELRAPNHFSKLRAQYLVVKINSEPVLKNGLLRFTTDVEAAVTPVQRTVTSGTLLVTIKDSSAKQLNYGDELLIPSKYSTVDPPYNPAEFNYKSYLARKNIFYQAFLFPKQYSILNAGLGNPITAHSIHLRKQLVDKLRRSIRDTDAYAVASAVILGYKADLSSDIMEAYSKTGTVYVLTVSGAQVAIIYLVLAYALGFLNRFKHGKAIKAAIIIAVVWYYALLTGFPIAICRAALMLSFVLTGKTAARYVNTLNILAASAFILLCYDPYYITEAGFQLSYLAVFGVVVLRPVVYKWFHFKNKIADKVWAVCSFSIAIQLAICPLCLFYFHQFPVYFLVSNLFVILPSAIIVYAGLFFLLLPKIPLISTAAAFILEKTTVVMNKVLVFIEHLPGASIDKIWLSFPEHLLLYAALICLFYFWYLKKVSWLKMALGCFVLLFVSVSVERIRQSATKNITMLNLKKHPGIIFKNGNSGIVLTDLKPTDKSYKYSIQPYLDSCQVKDVGVYDLNSAVNTSWFKKTLGLIQFRNTVIFIYDGKLYKNSLSQRLKTNVIYVTGNPSPDANALAANFDYQLLIIDGSNSDANISGWQKQLAAKGFNYKILKRNKYFAFASN